MAGLKQIKSKIRSVEKTQTVTKAMEAVSAAKMRKSQQKALSGRAYARAAAEVLARVSGSQALRNHPLTRRGAAASSAGVVHLATAGDAAAIGGDSASAKILYIVITSDKGLAGALNSAVLRGVQHDIAQHNLGTEAVAILAVGKKANDFFSARGYAVEIFYPNTDELTAERIEEIVRTAANRFSFGAVDTVKIAYQNFISTFEQRPTVHTIFPLSLAELEQVVEDITPARGRFAAAAPSAPVSTAAYSIEPSEQEVLDAIVPKLASIFVYHALLESQASEHSARMVAMKSASDKAEEMEHALTLQFNKARQAAITREVSEITGGMEAMAN